MLGVFTNDAVYSVACSIYCTKIAKNFSLFFQIFSWYMKSFLADLAVTEREASASKTVIWFLKSWIISDGE